jgi:hypothetical protein
VKVYFPPLPSLAEALNMVNYLRTMADRHPEWGFASDYRRAADMIETLLQAAGPDIK